MEPIGKLAEFVASLVPGQIDEPGRIAISMVAYGIIVAAIALVVPIGKRLPIVRRHLEPGERYAGRYVQIIGGMENRRYSLLEVFHHANAGRYCLKGFQYDSDGHRAIDFDSDTVAFQEQGPTPYFEFVWQAVTVADKERFDGYTRMSLDTTEVSDLAEGRGFFITFHNVPARYDLRFFKITNKRLQAITRDAPNIELPTPRDEATRGSFVRALHEALRDHPHLQPTEETGQPLL